MSEPQNQNARTSKRAQDLEDFHNDHRLFAVGSPRKSSSNSARLGAGMIQTRIAQGKAARPIEEIIIEARLEGRVGNIKSIERALGDVEERAFSATQAVASMVDVFSIISAGATVVGAPVSRALLKLETQLGLDEEETRRARDMARDVARRTYRDPADLLQAYFALRSAGLSEAVGTETLFTSAQLSAAQLGTTGSIASLIGGAINAFGQENITPERVGEIVLSTVQLGKLEAQDLTTTLPRALSLSTQLGVSLEEVGAAIAGFTRPGNAATEAVTAVRATMNALLSPTRQAQNILEELGLTIDQVKDMVGEQGLMQTLHNLFVLVGRDTTQMSRLINRLEANQFVFDLVGRRFDEYMGLLDKVQTSQGNVNRGFEAYLRSNVSVLDKGATLAKLRAESIFDRFVSKGLNVLGALPGAGMEAFGLAGSLWYMNRFALFSREATKIRDVTKKTAAMIFGKSLVPDPTASKAIRELDPKEARDYRMLLEQDKRTTGFLRSQAADFRFAEGGGKFRMYSPWQLWMSEFPIIGRFVKSRMSYGLDIADEVPVVGGRTPGGLHVIRDMGLRKESPAEIRAANRIEDQRRVRTARTTTGMLSRLRSTLGQGGSSALNALLYASAMPRGLMGLFSRGRDRVGGAFPLMNARFRTAMLSGQFAGLLSGGRARGRDSLTAMSNALRRVDQVRVDYFRSLDQRTRLDRFTAFRPDTMGRKRAQRFARMFEASDTARQNKLIERQLSRSAFPRLQNAWLNASLYAPMMARDLAGVFSRGFDRVGGGLGALFGRGGGGAGALLARRGGAAGALLGRGRSGVDSFLNRSNTALSNAINRVNQRRIDYFRSLDQRTMRDRFMALRPDQLGEKRARKLFDTADSARQRRLLERQLSQSLFPRLQNAWMTASFYAPMMARDLAGVFSRGFGRGRGAIGTFLGRVGGGLGALFGRGGGGAGALLARRGGAAGALLGRGRSGIESFLARSPTAMANALKRANQSRIDYFRSLDQRTLRDRFMALRPDAIGEKRARMLFDTAGPARQNKLLQGQLSRSAFPKLQSAWMSASFYAPMMAKDLMGLAPKARAAIKGMGLESVTAVSKIRGGFTEVSSRMSTLVTSLNLARTGVLSLSQEITSKLAAAFRALAVQMAAVAQTAWRGIITAFTVMAAQIPRMVTMIRTLTVAQAALAFVMLPLWGKIALALGAVSIVAVGLLAITGKLDDALRGVGNFFGMMNEQAGKLVPTVNPSQLLDPFQAVGVAGVGGALPANAFNNLSINSLTVETQATDAQSIASSISERMREEWENAAFQADSPIDR